MATLIKGFEKRDGLLIAAAAILYGGYLCLGHFSSASDASWHEKKLAASRLAQQSMADIKAEKHARGIGIDRLSDLNETGMIGIRYTGMTTTLGVLEAKRTSTHPDFAALAVDLLQQCGAQNGDRIAVNLSGSFPALAISVLSAAALRTEIARAGNDPERLTAMRSPFCAPHCCRRSTASAAKSGWVDVRLASSTPSVVVMPV